MKNVEPVTVGAQPGFVGNPGKKTVVIDMNRIPNAEKVLIDNGIDPDEAYLVLQAIGYVLLDTELYPED